MTCSNCKTNLPADVRFCPNCGHPVTPNTPDPNSSKKKTGCLTWLLYLSGFMVLFHLLLPMIFSNSSPNETTSTTSTSSVTVKEDKVNTDSQITKIENSLKCSKAQATNMYGKLKQVGISEITEVFLIDANKKAYQVSFLVNKTDNPFVVVYTDDTLTPKKIVYRNNILFENENIKSTINSNTLTDNERSSAISQSERAVKEYLHDPNSAEFINKHNVSKKDNIITVRGQFRAKNAYGAIVLNDYIVTIDNSNITVSIPQ